MLDYVISLLDDSNDFSWAAAEESNAVLFCHMEQVEIQHHTQTEMLNRIRRAQAQRHVPRGNQNSNSQSSIKSKITVLFFDQDTYNQNNTHETKGVFCKYICSVCFTRNGKAFRHANVDCRNKTRPSKND